jgi:hypothetical protein
LGVEVEFAATIAVSSTIAKIAVIFLFMFSHHFSSRALFLLAKDVALRQKSI